MLECRVSARKPGKSDSRTTYEKMVEAFSLTISRLGQVVDDRRSYSPEENKENVYALNQLHRFVARSEATKKGSINVSEFLSMRSPLYAKQVAILQSFQITTLHQFLRVPSLSSIRKRFSEELVRFPLVLEILHSSYDKS